MWDAMTFSNKSVKSMKVFLSRKSSSSRVAEMLKKKQHFDEALITIIGVASSTISTRVVESLCANQSLTIFALHQDLDHAGTELLVEMLKTNRCPALRDLSVRVSGSSLKHGFLSNCNLEKL